MNIALIAVDSTFPNLALMKIARYHRDRGDFKDFSPRIGFKCGEYFY